MGVIIALFTWGGTELDATFRQGKFPLWTTVLSLSGVGISIYLVIREVIKMSNEDEALEKQEKLKKNENS
jgi:hypothetical protein